MNPRPMLLNLMAAGWLGLVAGCVELAVLGWRKFVGHDFLFLSRDIVWLAPVMYALLALAAVAALRAACWIVPRLWTEQARLCVLLTLLCGSLLSLAGGLSKWSMLLLGMGLGVQGSRLLVARAAGFHRVVRATLPVLVAFVLVAGAGGAGLRAWRAHRAGAALPPPPPGAPNVLVIVWDVVRAASVSAYGYQRATTPHLERWAAGGVRFSTAYAPSSWTLPSHASLFTGRDAHELSADWKRPLDDEFPTLAESFSRAGYRTGGFAGNVFHCSYEGGLPRGFVTYEDYRLSPGEIGRSLGLVRSLLAWERFRRLTGYWEHAGRRSARQVNARLLRWLDQGQRRPFFAFLNYFDAHDPYLPRPPFDTLFGPLLTRLDPRLGPGTRWTPEAIRAERDAYERAIAGLDTDFGALLHAMEQRGLLRNTLVVVTADHGEEFGEHGEMSHGRTLYLPSIQVPLVVRFPGRVPEGVVVDRPVTLRDIPATVQSLTGVQEPRLPGQSLENLWHPTGDSSPQAMVVTWVGRRPDPPSTSRGDLWAVRSQGWRFIRNGENEALYFLPRDPGEWSDLAGSAAGSAVLPRLRAVVDSLAASRRAKRSIPDPQ